MERLGTKGVSEIVGTVLLLAVAIVTFSVLAMYVFSNASPSVSSPNANLIGYMNEEHFVVLEHKGGDDLVLEDTEFTIMKGEMDSASYYFSADGELTGEYCTFVGNGDDRWSVGEYVKINITALFGEVTNWEISAVMVDTESNSIILSGSLQEGIRRLSPPVAMFEYQPWRPNYSNSTGQSEIIVFNASTAYDPDGGQIVTYQWNFGDGTTGYGMVTVHRYSNVGVYPITLTVTDDEGQQGQATTVTGVGNQGGGVPGHVNVTYNQLPNVNFSWAPDDEVDGTINFYAIASDPDGNIANATYWWNFGDGNTSSSKNPSHTYDQSGQYTVTLIVTDEDGGIGSYEITVTVPNLLPIAGFTTSSSNITTSRSVTLDGGYPYSFDKDGSIVNWTWDYESDGEIDAYGTNVSHLFAIPGNYTITLTITDDDGGQATSTKNITVITPAEASAPRFLFVDNTPTGWDSGIDNLLAACQSIMPASDYSYGKAIDQWIFTDDQYTSEDLRGESISDTVLNEFDILIWSTGDFPGDGGEANEYPYNTMPNYWSTPMTEGGDDISDHMREVEEHMTGNQTAGVFLMCGTYAVRDLVNYEGNGVTQSEVDLGTVLGMYYDGNNQGGIDYDSDWMPFSGRLGSDWFRGEPYLLEGALTGVNNTSSGKINIATLNITSPMYAYGLNKQADPLFSYSLIPVTGESEQTIFSEDMESDPDWYTGGYEDEWDWGICLGGPGYGNAHSGTRCYGTDMSGSNFHYNDDADCYVRVGPIDLNDATSATLTFWDYFEIETNYDYVRLQVYDGSWHTVATYTGYQTSWTEKSYDLSSYVGEDIYIRWNLDSDGNIEYDGYYLDDVTLTATQSSMPAANFAIDAARGTNRSIILGFDLNSDAITAESRSNYLRNVLAWLAEGAGYVTEVWINNNPPEGWLDDESHFSSIQTGVNAVPPGGRVNVIGTDGQIYEENVIIEKSIDLIGVDQPTINASGNKIITVESDWVTIRGFNVTGNSAQTGIYVGDATRSTICNCNISGDISKYGIWLMYSHNNTVHDVSLRGCQYGIYAANSLGNKIWDNTIASNTAGLYLDDTSLNNVSGNLIENNSGAGIHMDSGRHNTIYNNVIWNNGGAGIHMISSTNKNQIRKNTIDTNAYGLRFEISNSNIVTDNTITNATHDGVLCERFSNANTIRENTIRDNGGCGINMQNASSNGITYNTVKNNVYGMTFSSSSSNVLQANEITNNSGAGLHLLASSNRNVIFGCNLSDNAYGLYITASQNNTCEQNTITNNDASGVYLYFSMTGVLGENRIGNNTIHANIGSGVYLYASTGNSVHNNSIYQNSEDGIRLFGSSDQNTITVNTVYQNGHGLHLDRSNFNRLENNSVHNNTNNGINLKNYASENSIRNNTIQHNVHGVALASSTVNNLSGNTIRNNQQRGISFSSASSNTVCENDVYQNAGDGIYLYGSDTNTISGNDIYSNQAGVHLVLSGGTGNIISNNSIRLNTGNGVYLENSRTATAGNNELVGNSISDNGGSGVYLLYSNINSIQQNTVAENTENGVRLQNSDSNTISQNIVELNGCHGLLLEQANNNVIQSNVMANNTQGGLYLFRSSQGDSLPIQLNTIRDNGEAGICVVTSEYNYFLHNAISYNAHGFYINTSASNNAVYENNITGNGYGIFLATVDTTSNRIYANNFLGNTLHNDSQAYDNGENVWYVGTEGNYWSDRAPEEPYYAIPPHGVQDKYPLDDPKQW
jgi:flagellin-like protein